MKQQRRRAPKGRRSTPPAQSVQELCGVSVGRQQAYLAGHQAALFDELNASLRSVEDDPTKDDGRVTMPQWAFDACYDLVIEKMFLESKGKGPTSRWWQKYRKDLIHWHRYALVKNALREKRAYWPPKIPDVYEVVARELLGTAFAAKSSGIKSSVEVVTTALKNRKHARFFQSTAAELYAFLLNTPLQPKTTQGSGETYGHVFLLEKSPI